MVLWRAGLRLPRQTSGGIIVRLNALRSILTQPAPSATAADLARLITSGEPHARQAMPSEQADVAVKCQFPSYRVISCLPWQYLACAFRQVLPALLQAAAMF